MGTTLKLGGEQHPAFLRRAWGQGPGSPAPSQHAHWALLTLPNSASDLGSAEVSFGEPMYDDIGELPLAALYEEILEGKDGAPGEEGRAVATVVVTGVS